MPILILMNLIIIVTSFLLLKYYFYFKDVSDYLIAFFILFLSQIVLSLQLLGILNILNLGNAIVLNLGILLAVYSAIKITKVKAKDDLLLRFKSAINNLRFNRTEVFCLSAILGFGLVKIFINLVNPPFGWDDLNYHFTFPVEWLKHGNLDNPISVSGDPSVSYYPINGSLFFLWFILPLKNVFIADLGQIPFFIVAFLAVYSLSKKLNLSKEYALYSAAIFTLIPNYFKQLEIAYVDVMVAALFLASLNYLFVLSRDTSVRNVVLCSLSLGLMLGTKTTAMPLGFLLFVPLVYFCLNNYPLKKFFLNSLVIILLIVSVGGFSYIRNFIETGNPLYPLNLKLFNSVIFNGVIDNEVYRTGIRPGDFSLLKILFSEGLGAQTIIFLLPAIILGLPLTLAKRKRDLNFNLVYFMILPILLILVFRFIIPLPNLRYIYSLFGIGMIIAFYIAGILRVHRKLLKGLIVICVLASATELSGHLKLVISLILSFVLFFTLPYFIKLIKAKRGIKYIIIAVILFCLSLIVLEKDYIRNEYPRYVKMTDYSGFWPDATKAWLWLNQNTEGDNIAYIGRPTPFPLFGTYFKNNVYYVSVNEVEPAKLHYFPDSRYIWGYAGDKIFRNFEDDNNYRGNADYGVWFNNLLARKTDYLFVYSEPRLLTAEPFPMEDIWAREHPENFRLVFANETVRIYKIIR